jgi:hypothetical protein
VHEAALQELRARVSRPALLRRARVQPPGPTGTDLMTPEQVIAHLSARTMSLDLRRPDPLVVDSDRAEVLRAAANRPTFRALSGAVEDLRMSPAPSNTQTRGKSPARDCLDAARVLAGMPSVSWLAVRVAVGVGDDSRSTLHKRLRGMAARKITDEKWPARMNRRHIPGRPAPCDLWYHDIVELALLELECPNDFGEVTKKSDFVGVSRQTWYAHWREPADYLSDRLWQWYYEGLGHIEGRLAGRR